MKIASAQTAIANDYQREESRGRRVTMVQSNPQGAQAGAQVTNSAAAAAVASQSAAMVEINQQNLQQSRLEAGSTKGSEEVNDELKGHYDKSLLLMKMILERMTGKPVDLFDASQIRDQAEAKVVSHDGMQVLAPGESGGNPNDVMLVENYHYEKESNALQFAGVIELENGSSTRFAMSVEFSQEYEEVSMELVKREELKDPLVISFSTEPVKLSGEKFEFDIDADGEKDNIANLEKGFGFLALDKNGDGVINDGSEMFGALSGNGFAELAKHDQNKDGFIDENDAIFDKLTIWVKNEDQDEQVSLKDKGIGAIALENVDSPFTLRDGEEKLGVIRKSGYYLNENGTAGLIQQFDYIV